ncbi:MAG: nuclear transport factor 2 family protein [Chloroflexi bacterium]|nr:nuclear transport factor 2 family protein [Chloroflexota bacterium]
MPSITTVHGRKVSEIMPESDPRIQILERILDALNKHNPRAVIRSFSPDCVLDSNRGPYPYGQRFNGIGAVEGAVNSLFDRVPDVKFDEAKIFIAGDLGFIMAHATGTAMTGERVDTRTCDVYEFSDGRVIKIDSYWKTTGQN